MAPAPGRTPTRIPGLATPPLTKPCRSRAPRTEPLPALSCVGPPPAPPPRRQLAGHDPGGPARCGSALQIRSRAHAADGRRGVGRCARRAALADPAPVDRRLVATGPGADGLGSGTPRTVRAALAGQTPRWLLRSPVTQVRVPLSRPPSISPCSSALGLLGLSSGGERPPVLS